MTPGKVSMATDNVRQLAVAFSVTGADSRLLSTVSDLVSEHAPEVSGIFIEDTELLDAAGLPFAFEICRTTNVLRRIRSGDIEQQIKECATEAEQMLQQTISGTGVKLSFRTVRTRPSAAIVEAARRVDLTVVAASLPHVMDTRRGAGAIVHADTGNVVAVIDQTDASRHALAAAVRLAKTRDIKTHVIAVGRTHPGLKRLVDNIEQQFGVGRETIFALYRPEFGEILRLISGLRASVTFLPFSLLRSAPERINEMNEHLQCPAVIAK